jgi:hypothetical protein
MGAEVEGQSPEAGGAPDAGAEVLEIYCALKVLLQRDDLPPGVRASAEQALSAMWQAVNNLGLEYEFLYDLGV